MPLQGSICTELVRRLSDYAAPLGRAVGVAAQVDCLTSLAAAAAEGRHVRPRLTREDVLRIKGGGAASSILLPRPCVLGAFKEAVAARNVASIAAASSPAAQIECRHELCSLANNDQQYSSLCGAAQGGTC